MSFIFCVKTCCKLKELHFVTGHWTITSGYRFLQKYWLLPPKEAIVPFEYALVISVYSSISKKQLFICPCIGSIYMGRTLSKCTMKIVKKDYTRAYK